MSFAGDASPLSGGGGGNVAAAVAAPLTLASSSSAPPLAPDDTPHVAPSLTAKASAPHANGFLPVSSTSHPTASPSLLIALSPGTGPPSPPAKVITLLRRPSSGPGHARTPPSVEHAHAGLGSSPAKKAASEGTGGGARSPSPAGSARSSGRGESLEHLAARTNAAANGDHGSTSSSLAAPSSRADTLDEVVDGPEDGDGDDAESEVALDEAIVLALSTPKDRLLLLRAELEMERFVTDSECVLLPRVSSHNRRN